MRGGLQPETQHFPPDGRLPGLGLVLVAVLFVVISPLALVALGLNYDELGAVHWRKSIPRRCFPLPFLECRRFTSATR